ncbi:MAG: hypothetical protein HY717_18500 [Planctomycetes bacterium]|nr:hypothetical protein [Planctomycetota bacterium]
MTTHIILPTNCPNSILTKSNLFEGASAFQPDFAISLKFSPFGCVLKDIDFGLSSHFHLSKNNRLQGETQELAGSILDIQRKVTGNFWKKSRRMKEVGEAGIERGGLEDVRGGGSFRFNSYQSHQRNLVNFLQNGLIPR